MEKWTPIKEIFNISTLVDTKNYISISKYFPFKVSLNETIHKNNYILQLKEEDKYNLTLLYYILETNLENKKVLVDSKGLNIIYKDSRGIDFIKLEDLERIEINI